MQGHNQNMRDHHPGIECYCLACYREFRCGQGPVGDAPPGEIYRAAQDARACGIGIIVNGRRVDPAEFYNQPEES